LKIIKGWKKISNQGGYVNENTGQTLIVAKKDFSENYHVLLFVGEQTDEAESKKISPEFSTKTKAEAIALDWMGKHPNGTVESKA
jgi:plasmid rolling circle replication initiator protein Rep